MAGKSDAFETALLDAMCNNNTTALTALFTANWFAALHTADPTDAATANELAYTGYGRVSITKSSGFTTSGNPRSNTGLVTWGTCTAGSGTATHWSLWTLVTAGVMIYAGALTGSLAISTSSNATPQAAIGALTIAED